MEVGAATFHPATTLRALGPKPWRAAYVQPSRRPKDGRYGENPNRLQHYYQFQVILKPSPPEPAGPLSRLAHRDRHRCCLHDIRFVEDDWESPTLGAWGLGWECWCDGMEVSQFTYFQQVAGIECAPVSGELTYGLERLAMYVQGVENVYDLNFNGREGAEKITYGDVFQQAEQEYSRHNFEAANVETLFQHFKDAEAECRALLGPARGEQRQLMVLPAYDQCIKASHIFNLLDARGVISVTERQSYILRVRELAKACGKAWLKTEAGGGNHARSPARTVLRRDPRAHAGPGGGRPAKAVTDALVRGALFEGAASFATPRRLALHVAGLPPRQADTREERKGPRVGAPAAAIEGFLKSAGLASIEAAKIEGCQERRVLCRRHRAPRPRHDRGAGRNPARHHQELSLAEEHALGRGLGCAATACAGCVRCMRSWRPSARRRKSPTSSTFAVDGIGAGESPTGIVSWRPAAIKVRRFDDYVAALANAKVVLDPARRRDIILHDARDLASPRARTRRGRGLLAEVAGLVEWPVVLVGEFDADFLDLPPEVIRATIRANQKCFVLRKPDDGLVLANKFILVANIVARDGGAAIAAGNGTGGAGAAQRCEILLRDRS